MTYLISLLLVFILFLFIRDKNDNQIMNIIDKYSYNLWISVPCIIALIGLAILAGLPIVNSNIRILSGTIFIFMIPKFIHIVSMEYGILRLFSLFLEVSSAYFVTTNIIGSWTNLNKVDYSTISFIFISFIAMVTMVVKSLVNDKKESKDMDIKQEIKQLKKISKRLLSNDLDSMIAQLNDMNDSNKLDKDGLKNFKYIINSNKNIKSHVKSIVTKISMKILGLK